ncbi:MAG: hypothetical protein IIW69_08245 [Bacteroidaceae bacterium]|nr:hypothetical protein [Bacteroidaceae bacterium]MBQ5872370.1 hypothetical protein [Bacteroidaceae bacterium]
MPDRHYSKTIEQHLLQPLKDADSEGLVRLLSSFSRSEQRTAGYMLGERLLLDCPAELYWQMTEALVCYDSKAYLITLMKTFLLRLSRGTASLSDVPFGRLAAGFNEVERQKVALLLLPELEQPKLVEQLFQLLGLAKGREQLVYLIRVDTLPCLFLLLRSLRYVEHDRAEVLKVARQLMKRGSGSSFNLASIVKVAFGLDELSGTFSLRLQPYQIARLEQSYEAFCQSVG